MNALEQQSQASESFWGTVAGVPRDEPLSDAQAESAEMRSGTGTALQQTSFGRATDPAAPQLPEQEQRPLSDWEMEELEDQTISDPSYIPTFNEWDSWDQKRASRSNAVNGFFQGAGSIASALGGVAWSLGKLPGDFVFRGFGPAYDTMVHSFAEGARRSGVGLAEIINYAGDVYADSRSDIRRSAAINDKIRKQLAAENRFTGNAQQDEAILEQAFHEARAAGLYDRTPEETAAQAQEDRKTAYDRFVRNRALEQEFLGIDNFTMGNDPIETGRIFGPKTVGGQPSQITAESVTKRAYGIDDSKVDEGLATFGMLALDPLSILPMGAGGLSKLRALRRISILANKPLGGLAKSAGWAATKAENLQERLMSAGLTSDRLAKASFGVAIGSGALGFSQNNDVAKGIALAAAVLPAVRKSGGILRGVESAAQSGQMVVKEMGVGGVGVFRADSASRLADDAAIPGRYREAMRGFFSGPESSLKRASQNEGMSLRARRTLGVLDNTGVTQAFRLADDAVSGGLAGAAVASPFALIAPEDQQSQIFGAIATMGAAGGLIGGPLARRTQMIDADIARMLADVDAAGGDAAYFSQLPHETLARYAAMQGVVSTKVDWVPLSAQDYATNLAMPAASRETTKGLFVDASDGNRPRIFLDIDQLASGDVAGHEIGHAILKSDILGGEIKNNMRNQVNVQYGQDGVQARGREYLSRIMAREVEAGVTGIKPEVLTDAEMQRVANGASPEDIVRARWEDPQMRQRMIDERIEDKNQRDLAEGNMEWDWARDEIAAETFSGLSGGIDFRRMREGGPLAGMLGAASGLFDMMGAKFRGNGRLETPNRVFEENPLFDTPEMRRAVTNYTKQFERYLVGMERDSAPKKRGTKVAPTGKASEAARSPHNRVYQNGAVVENDIFILDANGNPMPKSQQQVNTQEKARAATLKSINTRTRLVPVHSAEWGARKVGTRVEVGGPNLPLQFDNFVQVPQWLRTKAREFEAGRRTGQSYRVSYNAIGTGASGSYKVSNLGNVEAITREVVPFGWQLSNKNHLLAKVIDLDAFRAAAIRAVDRGELPEFNNNVKDVEAGLKVLLKNHEDGVPGETNLGAQKKNLLNGLLGTGTPTQKAANPLYGDLNPKGSIRTFRFDRLNYADPFGTGYFPHYHKINTNALPREVGVMSLDEWRQFDADRKSAYMNQQAARRGYSNATNWQGADTAGFRAADAEYRREFPIPSERPPEGAALPRDARPTPDTQLDPIEDSARKIHAVYDKSLLAKDRDSALYPKNPVPGSVVLPPRYGLVGNAPGMPRNFTEVRELVKLLADRVEDTGRRDVPFAQKSARFYSDMANEAVSLAEIVDPQSTGTARFNRADEMLRYLALGSQRTNVPVNSTKSAGAAASVVGDFTAGYKMGFGEAQRATRQAQADFKAGKHFNLDTKGVQDKVRTFYINGLSELIEVARKAGDTAAVEMLETRAAKSLKLVDQNTSKLTPEQLAETERILAGKATIDMWDMAAKRVAVPGYILDPKKRADVKQPFEWTQKSKSAKDTIGSPRWSKVAKELGIVSPTDLRYQQARSLGIEGNFDWTAETWQTRVDSGAPFAGGDFTTYTGSTDAGLSPGGGGRLYDAQQAIDGLLADELNRRGLASMFGKDKLFARNAQEILWAIEKKDNPILANNDLSLFGDSIQPLKQELQAIAGTGGQRNIRGAQVLDAMERAYTAMAKQEMPFEVATVGTGRTAAAINNALAAMKAAGDPDPLARMTAHYANNLADELTGLATEHGMKLQVDSVKTDLGGFTMDDGSYTETPQITAVIRGNTGDTNYLMQVVNEAVEQQGGNLFRRPSVKELYDPAVEKQPVVSFETSQMTTAQRTAFVTDLAKIRDDKGDRIFTGYTPSKNGVFIGGQFYNGDFAAAVRAASPTLNATMKKHGVATYGVENMIVPSYRSSDPVAPSAFRDAVQKLFYDKAVSGVAADAPTSILQPASVAANLQSRLKKNEAMFAGRDNLDALAKAINESGSMSADQALARVGQTMEIPGTKKMQSAFSDYVRGNRNKYDALPAADKKAVSEYIKQAREAAKALRNQEVAFSKAAKEGIRQRRSEIADRYDPQRALDEIDAASLLGYMGDLEGVP
jgi:hypothetical protein